MYILSLTLISKSSLCYRWINELCSSIEQGLEVFSCLTALSKEVCDVALDGEVLRPIDYVDIYNTV